MTDNSAYSWVEQIVGNESPDLEPVEGEWGLFFAGEYNSENYCILFPETEEKYSSSTGLLTAKNESIQNHNDCFIIIWSKNDNDLALLFINDLLKTQKFVNNPINTFRSKEKVWKHFTPDDTANSLIREVIGLWGEINFVVNIPKLAKYWNGPLGSDIDIVTQASMIEVKSTTKKSFDSISISNIWQLDDSENDVFLVIQRIELSTGSGKSLNDLFKHLKKLELEQRLMAAVESKVKYFGKKLSRLKFVVREMKIYPVAEDFPKVSKSVLLKCLSKSAVDRIKKLNYSVSVSGLDTITPSELIKDL